MPKIFISNFASERRKTSGAKRRELAFQIGKRWRLLLVKRFARVELVEDLLHQIGGAKRGRSPWPPWSKKKKTETPVVVSKTTSDIDMIKHQTFLGFV